MRRLPLPLLALILSPSANAQTGSAKEALEAMFRMAASHDHYVIVATRDKIEPTDEAPGGPGGHTLIYVKGAVFDYSSGLRSAVIEKSQARPAPPGLEHTGVLASIDSGNDNIAALITADNSDGRDALKGGAIEGVLDRDELNAEIDRVLRYRTYEGVQVKESLVDRGLPADQYTREVARISLGTDMAILYGSNLYLVGFPTDREGVRRWAKWVNEYNRPYALDQKKYNWHLLYQNCQHFVAGSLHAMCVRNAIGERLPLLKQVFNIALPRNGISTVQALVHHGGRNLIRQWLSPSKSGIEFETIRNNRLWWGLLKEGRRLPVGLGALSAKLDTYKGDDLFKDDLWIAWMPHKIPGGHLSSVRDFKRPEFTEIEAHLNYWGAAIEIAFTESLERRQTDDRKLYQKWLLSLAEEHQRLRAEFEAEKTCRRIFLPTTD